VTDLAAGDFDLRVDGRPVRPIEVRRATAPLRVHIIVSDGGSGEFQPGVLRFVQMLGDRAEFAFTSVLVQPTRILDFTTDAKQIGAAIGKLGKRGTSPGGSQLMDAIDNAAKDLAAPLHRSVLLVLRRGGEAISRPGERVREALQKSGATVYVISTADSSRTVRAGAVENIAEGAEAAAQLNLVVEDGARDSGGYHREIPLTSAGATLMQLADEIMNPSEISYDVPAGAPAGGRIQITTTRRGAVVRAPRTLPNR
jgi:hypothetical protein